MPTLGSVQLAESRGVGETPTA